MTDRLANNMATERGRASARRSTWYLATIALSITMSLSPLPVAGQAAADEETVSDLVQPDGAVQIDAVASDDDIQQRLERIYATTRWYQDLEVRVDEGVVFLRGTCIRSDQCEWATNLARRTEGVVGVANQMQVSDSVDWNIEPALGTVESLARASIRQLPLIVLGLLVLVLTFLLAGLTRLIAGRLLARRLDNMILLQVMTTLSVLPVIVIGLYVFLQVAGLSRLAATVLGGTGLLGLIIGIAFRDIAENSLASILISVKRPFRIGHQIRIDNDEGFVQSVTMRGTLLMTAAGNHVHIPNARIYKSTVYNFSANPRTRFDFAVGIDYGDSTARAQEVCLGVLQEHPNVLNDPEPLVLVENLGASSVGLRVYFWVLTREHSGLKVRSSVIRKVKAAIDAAGLTMPDDAREVIFPRPVSIVMEDKPSADPNAPARGAATTPPAADSETTTEAEGDLTNESEEIRKQAADSDQLDLGPDIVAETDTEKGAGPAGAPAR